MRSRRQVLSAVCVGLVVWLSRCDPVAACAGDCNRNGRVSIDELVRAVNISLDQAALSVCPAVDNSLDGTASVDELVLSVNRALHGCLMGPSDAVLYSPQGNQLDIYDLTTDAGQVLVPATRAHVQGQACLLTDGSGSFVVGDVTDSATVPRGWGLYSSDGTFLRQITVPEAAGENGVVDPVGCGFDSTGRLFTTFRETEPGSGGRVYVFFPPRYEEACVVDNNLRTPGPVLIDGDTVVVADAGPPAKVWRYDGPFPATPAECEVRPGLKATLINYDNEVAPYAVARGADGHWYVSVVSSPDGATIEERDANGNLLRNLVTPGKAGNPAGLAVASDGTIYFSDLGVDGQLQPVAGKANIRKIVFDAAHDPGVPEVVGRDLTTAAAIALLPKRLPESLMYGGSLRRTLYNPFEHTITRDTVARLVPKWRYTTGAIITASPAIAQIPLPDEGAVQLVFIPSWDGNLYALREENGSRVWSYTMKPQPGSSYPFASSPTVAWVNGRPIVFVGGGMTMYAVDAVTGAEIWQFDAGTGCTDCGFDPNDPSHRERNEILSSPGVIDGRVLFGMDVDDGNGKGGLYAVAAEDGRLVWYFDVTTMQTCRPLTTDNVRHFDGYHSAAALGLPEDFFATRPGCNFDRFPNHCGNIWSSVAIDARRGLLYTDSSNCDTDNDPQTPDPAPPMPPYDEAIFAVTLDGDPAWKWRPRDEDLFDFDFGAVPNLFEAAVGGATREAIGVGGKDGTYYLLDRSGINQITRAIEPYWRQTVKCGTDACAGPIGGIIGSASVGEGRIFFSTGIGFSLSRLQKPATHALTATDGAIVWENNKQVPSYAPTAGVPGVVFMGELASGKVHAYDSDSGTELALLDAKGAPGGVSALSVIVGGELFVGGGTGTRGGEPDEGTLAASIDTPLTAFCVQGENGCPPAPCDDSNPCTYDYRKNGACTSENAPNTLSCTIDNAAGECHDGTCMPVAAE